jgi:hypothetical protein
VTERLVKLHYVGPFPPRQVVCPWHPVLSVDEVTGDAVYGPIEEAPPMADHSTTKERAAHLLEHYGPDSPSFLFERAGYEEVPALREYREEDYAPPEPPRLDPPETIRVRAPKEGEKGRSE